MRKGWNSTPLVEERYPQVEHIFRGMYPSELLVVSFMDKANPASNIRNWVEAIVSMTGFPILSLQHSCEPQPELLEWQYQGSCSPLTQRLGVEETYLYQGLAKLPINVPELARFYILLARRNTLAWKVSLSFMSACTPGTPQEIIADNDHVRAAATFGGLCLL